MELTKQRKVLIGVVALGGAALIMDRFVLGTGATQPAAAAAAGAEATPTRAPAGGKQATPEPPRVTLAERLEKASLVKDGAVADAFAPPPDLMRAAVAQPAKPGDPQSASQPDIRLTTVFLGRRNVAVINGRNLAEGEDFTDAKGNKLFTLVSVDKFGVVIERSGVRARLDLAAPPAERPSDARVSPE